MSVLLQLAGVKGLMINCMVKNSIAYYNAVKISMGSGSIDRLSFEGWGY